MWTKSEGGRDAAIATQALAPGYYIRIHSMAILNALRSVVKYYPGQDLSGDFIEVPWPYPIPVHHYKELCHFRDEITKKEHDELCVRERDVASHLGLLLSFLDKEVMDMVKAERERNAKGCYTFDYMWVLLKPGSTFFLRIREDEEEGELVPGVIHSLAGGVYGYPREPWEISFWSRAYDGKYLGRILKILTWDKFDGEITTLDRKLVFIPNVYHENIAKADKDGNIGKAIEQGKSYWDLVKGRCKHHQGATAGMSTKR